MFRRLALTGTLTLALLGAAVPTSAAAIQKLGAPAAATEKLGASAAATDVLSVRGAGPFRIGVTQRSLADAGLLTGIATQPGCPIVRAGVTGEWAGKILLAFRNGRLVEVGTATAPPRSPAGAQVGMSWADLESVYGRRGHLIRNAAGEPAYVVHVGARVELFTGHPIRAGAGYFQVGPANFILRNFRHSPPC